MALDKDPAMLVQKGGGENTSCWNKGGLRRKQEHDFIKTQINMPSEAQIYIYIEVFRKDDTTVLVLMYQGLLLHHLQGQGNGAMGAGGRH